MPWCSWLPMSLYQIRIVTSGLGSDTYTGRAGRHTYPDRDTGVSPSRFVFEPLFEMYVNAPSFIRQFWALGAKHSHSGWMCRLVRSLHLKFNQLYHEGFQSRCQLLQYIFVLLCHSRFEPFIDTLVPCSSISWPHRPFLMSQVVRVSNTIPETPY